MTVHKFILGQRVRCIVTNFEGITIARVDHLNGCSQYCVKPQVDPEKPNDRPEGYYIDDVQLELVDEGILDPPADPNSYEGDPDLRAVAATGGPDAREGQLPT